MFSFTVIDGRRRDGCAEADEDGEDGELDFSFTVIDGGRRDGCVSLRVEEEDDEDEELGFSFTVIDGRRRDGCASLGIEEEMNDFGGVMGVSDGKMVIWAGRRW